jgi:hypothetical protein
MAITLNALFIKYGVRSDFVVSSVKDIATGVTLSNEENEAKIQKFRVGDLEVLVNVNILTEGTDLPQIQSVFLTRPTKSTILMTQMIGRALRGVEAKGTPDANIVSFIDDWQDKIAWVNPEQLFIDENVDFNETNHETQKQAMRLVSIAKIEEFARIANDTLDQQLSALTFIERIPVGIYKFSYLTATDSGDDVEHNCNILVYDCMVKAYEELFDWIPSADLSDIQGAANKVDSVLFSVLDTKLGYSKQDVIDIIEYYKQYEILPERIELSERKDYDPTKIAKYIIDNDLNRKAQTEYIESEWKRGDKHWAAFIGTANDVSFNKIIEDAMRRLENPLKYAPSFMKPLSKAEEIQIKDLPLYEIHNRFPELGDKLRDDVYTKFTDAEGYYYSAESGYRSKRKLDFQVDHIIPMNSGGKTVPENLQLLRRDENMRKSNH